jgi:signal transduction histidine kinase
MKFRDLKLGAKQRFGFGLVLLIMAGVNIYSINRMAVLKRDIDEVTKNWLPRAIAISDINVNTSELRRNQLQHAFAVDEAIKQQQAAAMITLIDRINENIDTYEQLKAESEKRDLYSEAERQLYAEFDRQWEQYLDLSFEFLRLSQDNEMQAALALLDGDAREVYSAASRNLAQLVEVNKLDSEKAAARAEVTFRQARRFTYSLLAITVLVSAFLVAWLVRLITMPMQQLEHAAGRVAQGDLNVQLEIVSKDEIGSVALSFNQMTRSLRDAKQQTELQEQKLRTQNEYLAKTMHQLKTTQEQLLLKEKMAALGDLVAGVAHEINNPIGVVIASTDVSQRCVDKIEGVLHKSKSLPEISRSHLLEKSLKILRENIAVTLTAAERIASLVKSLKNFTRVDESEYQRTNIHDGIDSSLTLMESEMRGRIRVKKEYGEIPAISCYPGQLNQVFINLLKNACGAIAGSGTIGIKTFKENNHIYVEISDTGCGIPPEKLERLFDFGFSSGGSRVKMSSGLSSAYNIIQKHEGEIKVESEVGKGTTFSIILPIK